VSSLFVADPRRTDEPVLASLLAQAGADECWIDVGAGAGRYALPLALRVRQVIAVEPSPGMRRALRAGLDEHGIVNVSVVAGEWPQALDSVGDLPAADVALIAHVGYDIEEIGPFLDGLDAVARDRCVAVLTDTSPAAVADPFWPLVHGEPRVPLPALPELLALLHARGAQTELVRLPRSPRRFEEVASLASFLRRQLFIAEGGEKDVRFAEVLADRIVARDGAWTLAEGPAGAVGVITWRAPRP
jgi:SAM-dependent methyltransferase